MGRFGVPGLQGWVVTSPSLGTPERPQRPLAMGPSHHPRVHPAAGGTPTGRRDRPTEGNSTLRRQALQKKRGSGGFSNPTAV